ncbi:MAG: GatB/YqeY domain-containing protein [Bacteroidota bacterium]
MSLSETISRDLQAAMKKGDTLRLETLRTIRAALLEKEIEKRGSAGGITPEDELGVLSASAKKRRESIELFRAGNRNELADQEERELAIIQEYLPKQLSAEEVEAIVKQVIQETGASGAKDFGKAMPVAMKSLKGKADGKMVQEMVKRILGA